MHSSARKARLITDLIRGRSVPEARTILAFSKRAVAEDVEKVLRSADRERRVAARPALERRRSRRRHRVRRRGPDAEALPPAHAAASADLKRTCHITVELAPEPARRSPLAEAAAAAAPKRAARTEEGCRAARTTESHEAATRSQSPRRVRANGSENPSGRNARRRHPRLEVELVHGQEGVPGVHPRGRQAFASTSTRSSRTRACPTS